MAEPTTAGRVRAGLLLLVADPAWWPTAHPAAFRNRLLDEGGGDSRPYVGLAWRLHELGVGARLARHEGTPIARCRAVARDVAAEALLDREAVWWGVVSWALALGLVDAADVAAAEAPVSTAAAALPAAPRPVPSRSTTAAPRPASGTAPPTAPASPPRRRWTIGTPGTPRSPLPRGPSPTAVVGLVGLIAGLFALLLVAGRLLRPRTTAASVPVVSVPDTATVAPAPPTRDSAPAADAPPPVMDAPEATSLPRGIAGEVRLRDGRRLGGVIDLLTATDVFLHDTTTNLPIAMPLAFVAEVRTADGRVAWRAAPDAEPPGASPPAVGLRARGVAGTYRVLVRSATVDGDVTCRDAWARSAAALLERIAHQPGDSLATLASRPGVTLRLAPDGGFVAGPARGADGPTQWRFAMRGQFAPEGFTASSDLRTETTLRWRRVQRCWIRADLAGVRRR